MARDCLFLTVFDGLMINYTDIDDYAWHIYSLVAILVAAGAYWSRDHWIPHVARFIPILASYRSLALSPANETFRNDIQLGLSSSNFDLEENISNYDQRAGLDEVSKREILNLMDQNDGYTFDQARLVYSQQQMLLNGIDHEGIPQDPKAIFFGSRS